MSSAYAKLPRGVGWEYRVHRAAFLSGWYVRRGVNLRERVRSSPQTMAEVDILGIGFDVALTRRTLVGECKDRKGGAKEADRVTWLLGLARMLAADHIMFAKTQLAEGTLQFARPYGLLLWDEAAVLAIEKRCGLAPDSGFYGSWNVELREGLLAPSRKGAALKDLSFRAAWDFLAGAFWYQTNPQRTKRLAGYFEALAAAPGLTGDARSAFVAEGLLALLVTLYTTAGQLGSASPARAESWLIDSFASGAADARALREIAARADDYYQDALRKTARDGGARGTADVPRLAPIVAEPPPWLGAYLTLAADIAPQPQIATDVLRYAELVLLEEIVAGNDPAAALKQIGQPHADLARVLELGALFLQRIWGVDDPLLDKALQPRATGAPSGPTLKTGRANVVAPPAGPTTQLALQNPLDTNKSG